MLLTDKKKTKSCFVTVNSNKNEKFDNKND